MNMNMDIEEENNNNNNNFNMNDINNNINTYKNSHPNLLNYIKINFPIKDINKSNEKGNYFLSWACANDDLDVVKYFLENGANINIEGENKYTPLHFAYANGHFRIIDLLEEKGANQYAEDKDGRKPWQHFALYVVGGSLHCF
jgi:ankyrin repeat protein